MIITLIASLILNNSFAKADEMKVAEQPIKAEVQSTPQDVELDKNLNNVIPSYSNIDGKDVKKEFSWGTVFYTSITSPDEHDSSGNSQVHLNIRYACKNGTKKAFPPQRFGFCGYAKSEVDKKQRELIISELKKAPENKGKTDADLNAIYDAEYNDRIVDPAWNILEKKEGNKISLEITVRQKEARFGACEEKITSLPLAVDCK